jgi:chorismate-pyruvate lyase
MAKLFLRPGRLAVAGIIRPSKLPAPPSNRLVTKSPPMEHPMRLSAQHSPTLHATMRATLSAAFIFAATATGHAADVAAWPDSYQSRLQVLALVQTINANILASTSATLTLEKWCGDHAMSGTPKVTAHLQRDIVKAATAAQRERLQVGAETPVKYRRVQLYCGDHLLSEADNWYVPERLSPATNRLLDETDTPFGKAVLPLAPYRRTFDTKTLWSPLPEQWETGLAPQPAATAGATLAIPAALFEHSAVLYTSAHLPFSEVRETYQRGLLDFNPPAPK